MMMLTRKRKKKKVKKLREELLSTVTVISNFILKKDTFVTIKVNYKKLALNCAFQRL